MFDKNSLKSRILRVLEENKMKASELDKEIKKTSALLFFLSSGIISFLGSNQILVANKQRAFPATRVLSEEMLPLHNEKPVYPEVAFDDRVEGWVHVRFTVNPNGCVSEESIVVVGYSPSEIFNNSALDAIRKFKFSPRVIDGERVAVKNVQYVFYYKLPRVLE